jgi:hypothetical protein
MIFLDEIECPVVLNKTLIANEILTEAGDEDSSTSEFYVTDSNTKIRSDILKYIVETCKPCGLNNAVEWSYFILSGSLWFTDQSCNNSDTHKSIFHELYFDAYDAGKKIFTHQIMDGMHWTSGTEYDFDGYPINILNYENEDGLIRDLISAANFIKKTLG